MENINKKNLKKVINLKKYPEPFLPGLFKINIVPNINLKNHDGTIDDYFRKIHTPYTTFFQIDFLEEIRKLENDNVSDSWLRKNFQLNNDYYRKQSDRMLNLKRAKEYLEIYDLKNYQEDVSLSFEKVNDDLDQYIVEEEYPLFPNEFPTYVLINKNFEEDEIFINKEKQSSLIETCTVKDKKYEYLKQMSNDKIFIEIRDGKAYYANINYFYKFK